MSNLRNTALTLAVLAVGLLPGVALAADLGVEVPDGVVVTDSQYDWDGLYVGINVGRLSGTWTLSQYDGRTVGGGFVGDENSRGATGTQVGIDVGYNTTMSGLVVGVEGDLNWNNAEADPWGFSFDGCGCATTSTKLNGTARVRVGVPVGMALIYATAGVAGGNTYYEYRDGPVDSETHFGVGPAYGAGVEFGLTEQLSAKLEYLHSDYGSPVFFDGDADFESTVHASSDVIRVGINFHTR